MTDKTVALFVDVDNCGLQYEHYVNALEAISEFGAISCGKIYGASGIRHKEILADANNKGFDVALPMRQKKRGSKVFDGRIAVDVVETVLTNPAVDAVAIIAAPADMVYLYRFLKRNNVAVIALDNADEESCALVDEFVDLGKVEVLKVPKKVTEKPAKNNQKPLPVETEKPAEKAPEQQPEPVAAQEKPSKAEEAPQDEKVVSAESLAARANSLLDEIERLKSSKAEEQAVAAEQTAQNDESQADPDADLLRKIDQVQKTESDDQQLVDTIKALLDGIE